MRLSIKIVLGILVGLLIILGIWIITLRTKLNHNTDDKRNFWKEKYESAQDSIIRIKIERDKLAKERIYLDSTKTYWINQYKYADSLLNNVKPKYNEKIHIIRTADAGKRNSLLSERINQINNRRN